MPVVRNRVHACKPAIFRAIPCCLHAHLRFCRFSDVFRLEEWLREAGVTPSKFSTTARALRENDFDDQSLLARVTADDLKDCGITSVGIRKCILESVRRDTGSEDVKYGMCKWREERSAGLILLETHASNTLEL